MGMERSRQLNPVQNVLKIRGSDVLLQVKVAKKKKKKKKKKKREKVYVYKVVGGQPITEDNVFMNAQYYVSVQSSKSKGKTIFQNHPLCLKSLLHLKVENTLVKTQV